MGYRGFLWENAIEIFEGLETQMNSHRSEGLPRGKSQNRFEAKDFHAESHSFWGISPKLSFILVFRAETSPYSPFLRIHSGLFIENTLIKEKGGIFTFFTNPFRVIHRKHPD